MEWFRKNRPDTVDFTKLQRTVKSESVDIVDLGKTNASNKSISSTTASSDFLSSLANVGSTGNATSGLGVTGNLREARRRNLVGSEVNELKIKLEDTEYKLRNLTDKVRQLEEKISAFYSVRH